MSSSSSSLSSSFPPPPSSSSSRRRFHLSCNVHPARINVEFSNRGRECESEFRFAPYAHSLARSTFVRQYVHTTSIKAAPPLTNAPSGRPKRAKRPRDGANRRRSASRASIDSIAAAASPPRLNRRIRNFLSTLVRLVDDTRRRPVRHMINRRSRSAAQNEKSYAPISVSPAPAASRSLAYCLHVHVHLHLHVRGYHIPPTGCRVSSPTTPFPPFPF